MPETMRTSQGDTFTITSDRLTVTLAQPGSPIQKGARFDLTGHVIEVELDGRHVFSAPEAFDEGRGSGGLGLCNEFYDPANTFYKAAGIGERYPKLGVGLLLRDDGEHNFMTHYEKIPYPTEVSAGQSTARFVVQPMECQGYAVRLEKKLTAQGNNLVIETSMENVGRLPIDLLEYNHNFVCIDRKPIGPEYRLRLPFAVDVKKDPDVLVMDGTAVAWKGIPAEPFYCLTEELNAAGCHSWELIHTPGGVGMREIDDFPMHHLALWGVSHVVSPEVFIRILLQPGESMAWTRKYEFFTI